MKRRWLWAWCSLIIVAAATVGVYYQEVSSHKGIGEIKTGEKIIALTFDDGPDIVTTPRILQVLKQYNARATFFVMGKQAEDLPGRMAQIVYENHEIGNHGFSHRWLTKLSESELAEEIARTEASIMLHTVKPRLFRPPGAFYNNRIIEMLRKKGYDMIMWSIDSKDWARTDPQVIASDVLRQIKPGSIVLMHDGTFSPGTAEAAAMILKQLSQDGYQFVTVSELLTYSVTKQSEKP